MCSIAAGTKAINLNEDWTGQLCEVGLLATKNGSLVLLILIAKGSIATEWYKKAFSMVFGVFS